MKFFISEIFKVDGAWNLSDDLGPYRPPLVPTKIWDHLAHEEAEKVNFFTDEIFKVDGGWNLSEVLGPNRWPQVHTQIWQHLANEEEKNLEKNFSSILSQCDYR